MSVKEQFTIKSGDFVVVKRQGYTKLHKLKPQGKLVIGKFTIKMDNIIGEKYFDTFQMKNCIDNKKFYTLEKVEDVSSSNPSTNSKNVNNIIRPSGKDNRNIIIDGESQSLTKDDIDKLQNQELNSSAIIGELVNNSKTFNMKTEYSQAKYIKKKEKKYFEYIEIRKPSIRLLTSIFNRQDPTKTIGIRIDDLSQILTYANIHSDGNHLLYDSGTSGLMPAAIINGIGANTEGKLIHMFPGNECQKNAFLAMQFPEEQKERCINVNLYSVLRYFYQKYDENNSNEPLAKKIKITNEEEPKNKPQWQIENEKACRILKNKCDTLIITSKEHPVNIVKELIQFLNSGRQIVVFNLMREPLEELFIYLKSRLDIVAIRLNNNFLRKYQVLPERTHPEVNMNSGGYLLSAVKLNC